MMLDYPQYHIFFERGRTVTQHSYAKQNAYAAPTMSDDFACAAAASLVLLLSTLNEISLSVLIVPVAVALISISIRLAHPRRSPRMEQA